MMCSLLPPASGPAFYHTVPPFDSLVTLICMLHYVLCEPKDTPVPQKEPGKKKNSGVESMRSFGSLQCEMLLFDAVQRVNLAHKTTKQLNERTSRET